MTASEGSRSSLIPIQAVTA